MSLPRSGKCFRLVVPRVKYISTNQKHYPDLGSDVSSGKNERTKICYSENFIRSVIDAANIKKEKLHNKFIKFLVDVSCNHW